MTSGSKTPTRIQTTLLQHYFHEYDAPERDDMTLLFNAIQQACKSIAALVRVAPLEGLLGKTGGKNSMGEEVQQLDIMSNDLFIDGTVATLFKLYTLLIHAQGFTNLID